ncbi:hypothetical protein WH47_00476 [Habropoda laboriosa]|uniref:Uncharacterized protein n=1 Tax=Habropoda laboriosa TaxID=597456 RepID=A0A0L7QKI2_9HYME|nr:hypothetical protein WH47_00476 [Habropoda laboriosa]
MAERTKTTAPATRPVPMKLFATWEVDRTAPNCIPRFLLEFGVELPGVNPPYILKDFGDIRYHKKEILESHVGKVAKNLLKPGGCLNGGKSGLLYTICRPCAAAGTPKLTEIRADKYLKPWSGPYKEFLYPAKVKLILIYLLKTACS